MAVAGGGVTHAWTEGRKARKYIRIVLHSYKFLLILQGKAG